LKFGVSSDLALSEPKKLPFFGNFFDRVRGNPDTRTPDGSSPESRDDDAVDEEAKELIATETKLFYRLEL
jgi:hypothetical protein